jgi:protein-tyrosine phosphatase
MLLDFAPHLNQADVPDPYYGGEHGFERVLDLVETAAQGLLEHIRKTHFE